MKAEMFGLNGKSGFVTIEPADGTIEVNNTTPHIIYKSGWYRWWCEKLKRKTGRHNDGVIR
jgi:hypothetical protein